MFQKLRLHKIFNSRQACSVKKRQKYKHLYFGKEGRKRQNSQGIRAPGAVECGVITTTVLRKSERIFCCSALEKGNWYLLIALLRTGYESTAGRTAQLLWYLQKHHHVREIQNFAHFLDLLGPELAFLYIVLLILRIFKCHQCRPCCSPPHRKPISTEARNFPPLPLHLSQGGKTP